MSLGGNFSLDPHCSERGIYLLHFPPPGSGAACWPGCHVDGVVHASPGGAAVGRGSRGVCGGLSIRVRGSGPFTGGAPPLTSL
jgi:hypothetical protein